MAKFRLSILFCALLVATASSADVTLSDEEVTEICSSANNMGDVDSNPDFSTLSGCGTTWDDADCTAGTDEENEECVACQMDTVANLDILNVFPRCIKDACASTNQSGELIACLQDMRYTYQHMFQFSSPDYKDQLKQSCSCGYPTSTNSANDDGTSHCDFNYMINCAPSFLNTKCINVQKIVKSRECCSKTGSEQDACFELVLEKIERTRIQMYCKMELKLMLQQDKVENLKCKEFADYKTFLTTACSDQCFTAVDEPSLYAYMYDYDFFTPKDAFKLKCGHFEGATYNGTLMDFYEKTVYFRGQKNAWDNVLDTCLGYRANGALDIDHLKYAPYPREVLSVKDFEAALNEACEPSYTYSTVPQDTTSLDGYPETEALKDQGVLLDFGFTSGVMRSLLRAHTKKCWEYTPVHGDCTVVANHEQCVGNPKQASIAESSKPEDMVWFLHQIGDTASRAWALKACAKGARLGKTLSSFIGPVISLEAQHLATTKIGDARIPQGYQTLYMLAFQTCGVMAGMEVNEYFADGASCNAHVLDPDYVRSPCPAQSPHDL